MSKRAGISVSVCILTAALLTIFAQPVLAWGPITHVKMSTVAGNPYPSYSSEYLSGSIAPDAGYLIAYKWGEHFHGKNVSQALEIARDMLNLAETKKEKAFARGWFAHLMQDRVAHGTGQGFPNDPAFGVGYSNYAAKKYKISHKRAEFYVDGRIVYEKGCNGLVTLSIPINLVTKTMEKVYHNAPDKNSLSHAYFEFALAYYSEQAFWSSPAGLALYDYIHWKGTVADYDKYVPDIGCNPYKESIYLTNHPRSVESISKYNTNLKHPSIGDGINPWMLAFAKRLERCGAMKVTKKYQNGWLTIKLERMNRGLVNRIAMETLMDMVKAGSVPVKVLSVIP